MDVLLHAEKLVLRVGKSDAKCHAAVGHGDILLHSNLPGALHSAVVATEDVEEGVSGYVHGHHSHVVHWRKKTRSKLHYSKYTFFNNQNPRTQTCLTFGLNQLNLQYHAAIGPNALMVVTQLT